MISLNEYRSLIPVKCFYNEGMDCFVFKFNGKTISVKGVTDEELAKAFRVSQMKDEETTPRSQRGKTICRWFRQLKLELIILIISGVIMKILLLQNFSLL